MWSMLESDILLSNMEEIQLTEAAIMAARGAGVVSEYSWLGPAFLSYHNLLLLS